MKMGAAVPPLSYRCRVLALQRQQRVLVASLDLPRPERATNLLMQREEALQTLAQQEAGLAQQAGTSEHASPNMAQAGTSEHG